MKNGAYKRRLRVAFISIAVCFLLIFGVLMSGLVFSMQSSIYRSALQQTIAAKYDSTQLCLNIIFSSLGNVQKSEAAHLWSSAQTKSDFYYYSVKLREILSRDTTNISLVNYELAVTNIADDIFMITPYATMSKEEYFTRAESGLTYSNWDEIKMHFKRSAEPFVCPIYNEEALESIYYVVSDTEKDATQLYFVKIPAATLFGNDASQRYLLYNNDKILAYSNTDAFSQKGLNRSYIFLNGQTNLQLKPYAQFNYEGKELFVLRPGKAGWTFAYQFNFQAISFAEVLLFIILPLGLLSGIAMLIISLIAEKLYKPISETISDVEFEDTPKGMVDEFFVIRQNIGTVSSLNSQLESAIGENASLAKQRFYRELLFSVPDADCPLTAVQMLASYCVALVEFEPCQNDLGIDDWYIHLQKNYLYLYVQSLRPQYNIYCISVGYNLSAIILETTDLEDSKKFIGQISEIAGITAILRIAISGIREEVIHIQDSYKEASELLEYRYLLPPSEIITSQSIGNIKNSAYYYPLVVENRLIQGIASGQDSAIELYKEVVKENANQKSLAPSIMRNLVFSLIGTILRVFQELKTTPQELLGEDIVFADLYTHASDAQIMQKLHILIEQIVAAVKLKSASSDDALLATMLDYIYNNYRDDIMLVDIAAHCNISPKYCSTLFKKLSSDNFKNFLNRYRMERAQEMIEKNPDIKIVNLSVAVGFNSSNSFIRVFSKYIGMTPKAYAEKISSELKGQFK